MLSQLCFQLFKRYCEPAAAHLLPGALILIIMYISQK